jgi:hypothetical protein
MSLSWLAVLLGLGYAAWQVYGLLRPSEYRSALQAFPRSPGWGTGLMLAATAWFLYNLQQEDISDFAAFKPYLLGGFAAVGIGACFYLRDFLAVRGLAILYMLLAKLMVDAARWVETDWRLVVVTWAYALVVVGMWLTVAPYRMRDWILWTTDSDRRMKIGIVVRLVFGAGVALLGATAFRG